MARIVEESYIKDLCEWIINCEKNYELDMSRIMAEIKEDIENMKELVRCKDCKHRESLWGELCCDIHDDECVKDEDFCSYGERREGE